MLKSASASSDLVPSQPAPVLKLDVRKKGSVIETITLSELFTADNKQCVTFGRRAEHANFVLDHQSISRKHAALRIGEHMILSIECLGATHGTVVYPSGRASSVKVIEGVQMKLHDGDVVVFGKSSREYIVRIEYPSLEDEKQHHNEHNVFRENASTEDKIGATDINKVESNNTISRDQREREIAAMVAGFSQAPQYTPNVLESEQGNDESSDEEFGPMPASNIKTNMNTDMDSSNTNNNIVKHEEDRQSQLEILSNAYKLPLSHEIELEGFQKKVNMCAFEQAGNRVLSASIDGHLNIFDFGGMDNTHKASRSLVPVEGIGVNHISVSSSADRFVVCVSNSQPLLYDREGRQILKFCKGDMYLRDLTHTKGHTTEVTCSSWHPCPQETEMKQNGTGNKGKKVVIEKKNVVLTGSADGTIRTWDLAQPLYLTVLQCIGVYKVKAAQGAALARVAVLSCCYSCKGDRIVASAADGSIHIWDVKIPLRTKAVLRPYSKAGQKRPDLDSPAITNVQIVDLGISDSELSSDLYSIVPGGAEALKDGVLACRGGDGSVFLYAYRTLHLPNAEPFLKVDGRAYPSGSTNLAFSPDMRTFCLAANGGVSDGNTIVFFDTIPSPNGLLDISGEEGGPYAKAVLHVPIISPSDKKGCNITYVQWVKSTNQILLATSWGGVRVLFDPKHSKKGALLSSGRAKRKEKEQVSFGDATKMEIYAPGALPMYRKESVQEKKRKADEMRRDASSNPSKAPRGKKISEGADHAVKKIMLENYGVGDIPPPVKEDPRDAILKYAKEAEENPMYSRSLGVRQALATNTLEEDLEKGKEEKRKKMER